MNFASESTLLVIHQLIGSLFRDFQAEAIILQGHKDETHLNIHIGLPVTYSSQLYTRVSSILSREIIIDSRYLKESIKLPRVSEAEKHLDFFVAVRINQLNDAILILFFTDPDRIIDLKTLLTHIEEVSNSIEEIGNGSHIKEDKKKLTCLHQILKLNNLKTGINSYIRKAGKILIKGLTYPQLTRIRITYRNFSFESVNFKTTKFNVIETQTTGNGNTLKLEIHYLEDMNSAFYHSERSIVETFCRIIISFINQKELLNRISEQFERQNTTNQLTRLGTLECNLNSGIVQLYLDSISKEILGIEPDAVVSHDDIMQIIDLPESKLRSEYEKIIGGEVVHSTVPILNSNNEKVWIKSILKATEIVKNNVRIIGSILDYTDEMETREILNRKTKILIAVAEINSILNKNEDLKKSIRDSLAIGGKVVTAEQIMTFESERTSGVLILTEHWVNPETTINKLPVERNYFLKTDVAMDSTLRLGDTFEINNSDHYTTNIDYLKNTNQHQKYVPVLIDEKLEIIILFVYSEEKEWSYEEHRLLKNIAFNVSNFIRRNNYQKHLNESLEKISNSERKHRLIFEGIKEGIFVRTNQKIIDCNPYLAQILNTTRKDIIGKSLIDFSPEYQPDGTRSLVRLNEINLRAFDKGETIDFEWLCSPRNTNIKKLCHVTLSQTNYDGKEVLFGLVRDVSEMHQAQHIITRLSKAVEQSPVMVLITNTEGKIEYINDAVTKTTGYSRQELLGKNPKILKSGHTPDAVYKELWEKIKNGHQWEGEFINKKKNGEIYWESTIISPVFDEHQNITSFLQIKEDITLKKKTQEALLASQKRFQEVAAINQSVIWEANQKGKITYISPGVDAIGFTVDEILQSTNKEITHIPTDLLKQFNANVKGKDFIVPINSKHGKIFWLKGRGIAIRQNGNITGYIGSVVDVSKELSLQKQTLKATIEAEQKERTRIAETLHNSLQQTLLAAQMHFQPIVDEIHNLNEQQAKIMKTGFDILKEGVEQTRSISHELRPPSLEFLGLGGAIKEIVEKFKGAIKFDFVYKISNDDIPKDLQLLIFRFTQEIINNIIKHSKASEAKIRITKPHEYQIQITAIDNGIGFNKSEVQERSNGIGLSSILANVDSLGGKVTIKPASPKGSHIVILLPAIQS